MNRNEILETAEKLVSNDRNDQYGEPSEAFAAIGELWTTYLRRRLPRMELEDAVHITRYDVGVMMSLLKIARLMRKPQKPDTHVDLAGYAACTGEISALDDKQDQLAMAKAAPMPRVPQAPQAPPIPIPQGRGPWKAT